MGCIDQTAEVPQEMTEPGVIEQEYDDVGCAGNVVWVRKATIPWILGRIWGQFCL